MQLLALKSKPRALNFLSNLSWKLHCKCDVDKTLAVGKAVLSAWRDSLPFDIAIEVQTALPVFLKPLFADGWKPIHNMGGNENDFLFHLFYNLNRINGVETPDNLQTIQVANIVLASAISQIDEDLRHKCAAYLPEEIKIFISGYESRGN